MPGPLHGLRVEKNSRMASYHVKTGGVTREYRYWSMHTHCASGVNCDGRGCKAVTGKTRG